MNNQPVEYNFANVPMTIYRSSAYNGEVCAVAIGRNIYYNPSAIHWFLFVLAADNDVIRQTVWTD